MALRLFRCVPRAGALAAFMWALLVGLLMLAASSAAQEFEVSGFVHVEGAPFDSTLVTTTESPSAIVQSLGAAVIRSIMLSTLPADAISWDSDLDGRPDVAVLSSQNLQVFANLDGVLSATPRTFPLEQSGSQFRALATGDFERNGRISLVALSGGVPSKIVLIKPSADGRADTVSLDAFNGATDSTVGDVNGDGFPDIVTCGEYSEVSVILNNGSGGFASSAVYGGTQACRGVAVGDFNRDGWLDIVTVSPNRFKVLINDQGTFPYSKALEYGLSGLDPTDVEMIDLTGEGYADIVMGHGTVAGTGALLILPNRDGSVQQVGQFATGGTVSSLLLHDLDRDHDRDIIVVDSQLRAHLYLENDGVGFVERQEKRVNIEGQPKRAAVFHPSAISGAEISIGGRVTYTDASGYFAVRVPVGVHPFIARHGAYEITSPAQLQVQGNTQVELVGRLVTTPPPTPTIAPTPIVTLPPEMPNGGQVQCVMVNGKRVAATVIKSHLVPVARQIRQLKRALDHAAPRKQRKIRIKIHSLAHLKAACGDSPQNGAPPIGESPNYNSEFVGTYVGYSNETEHGDGFGQIFTLTSGGQWISGLPPAGKTIDELQCMGEECYTYRIEGDTVVKTSKFGEWRGPRWYKKGPTLAICWYDRGTSRNGYISKTRCHYKVQGYHADLDITGYWGLTYSFDNSDTFYSDISTVGRDLILRADGSFEAHHFYSRSYDNLAQGSPPTFDPLGFIDGRFSRSVTSGRYLLLNSHTLEMKHSTGERTLHYLAVDGETVGAIPNWIYIEGFGFSWRGGGAA